MPKDLFSKQTSSYSKYRPYYPVELYEYLLQFVKTRDGVWDCGIGNGQAAIILAEYFKEVKATDISENQLAKANRHPRIEYITSPAEKTPFPDDSFDLVTVAQAYHWFDFKAFAEEVYRVSRPGGIIAIWGYNLVTTNNQNINTAITDFYTNVVGPYWDAERKYVEDNYNTVPFSFPLIASKTFTIENKWSKTDLIGYLNSWSAVQHFLAVKNFNPVDQFAAVLSGYLTDEELITVSFPVFLKIGSVE